MAAELNKLGHTVTVYERDEGPGGLLRFGVPDAKLEKWIIDRRVKLLEEEGIEFRYDVDVGRDVSADRAARDHDAVVVAIGSRVHRDLEVPGRELAACTTRWSTSTSATAVAAPRGVPAPTPPGQVISAAGKRVVVVGGGDTGWTASRTPCARAPEDVLLLDVYPPLPASGRPPGTPWPLPPKRTPTTYALDEGGERRFGTQVTELRGIDGRVCGVSAGAWRAPPRATCTRSPAASSTSAPTSC